MSKKRYNAEWIIHKLRKACKPSAEWVPTGPIVQETAPGSIRLQIFGHMGAPPPPFGVLVPLTGSAEKQKGACKLGRARSVAETRLHELNLAMPPARLLSSSNSSRPRIERVQRVRSQLEYFFAVVETIPVGIRVESVGSDGRLLYVK